MNINRIFLIVMDSVGIGSLEDADRFYNGGHNDIGTNTWLHVSQAKDDFSVPTLNALGIHDLCPQINGTNKVDHKQSYVQTLKEKSNGKDTLTGHWEMMGIITQNPLITFTETGFPKELIDKITKEAKVEFLGNVSASGTAIIDELGEQSIREKKMILYTSADSVLQIAASMEIFSLEKLYETCEIARRLTIENPQWKVGRVIARPFVGTKVGEFKRTSDRKDYSLPPSKKTYMMTLEENHHPVYAVGKIHDIFAGCGISQSYHIESNHYGMLKTIQLAKELNKDEKSFVFVNLCDFDVLYGHRRNALGYAKCIEEFDSDLAKLISELNENDLLMITADHGNDPTWYGTDHTRERVPLISYCKSFKNGRHIPEQNSFASIGETILKIFEIQNEKEIVGPISEIIND